MQCIKISRKLPADKQHFGSAVSLTKTFVFFWVILAALE